MSSYDEWLSVLTRGRRSRGRRRRTHAHLSAVRQSHQAPLHLEQSQAHGLVLSKLLSGI